jgi:hypothetical protein
VRRRNGTAELLNTPETTGGAIAEAVVVLSATPVLSRFARTDPMMMRAEGLEPPRLVATRT